MEGREAKMISEFVFLKVCEAYDCEGRQKRGAGVDSPIVNRIPNLEFISAPLSKEFGMTSAHSMSCLI